MDLVVWNLVTLGLIVILIRKPTQKHHGILIWTKIMVKRDEVRHAKRLTHVLGNAQVLGDSPSNLEVWIDVIGNSLVIQKEVPHVIVWVHALVCTQLISVVNYKRLAAPLPNNIGRAGAGSK